MKQHSVPENIMDVEFKLFGSLTAKQFGYILGGGVLALVFFFVFKELGSMLLAWIFVCISVFLGLSLALIRINDQPFEVWLGNFFAAMFTSQKRVWRKEKKHQGDLSDSKTQQISTPSVATQLPIRPQVQPKEAVETKFQKPALPQHPFKALNQSPSQVSTGQTSPSLSSSQDMNQKTATIAGEAKGGDYMYIPGSAQGAVKITSNQTPRPISIPGSTLNPNPQQAASQSAFLQPSATLGSNASNSFNTANTTAQPSNVNLDTDVDSINKDEQKIKEELPQTNASVSQNNPGNPVPQTPIPAQQNPPQDSSTGGPVTGGGSYINKAQLYSSVVPPKTTTLKSVMNDSTQSDVTSPSSSVDPQTVNEGDIKEENEALRQKVAEYSEEKSELDRELNQTKNVYMELKKQNELLNEQMNKLREDFSLIKAKQEREEEERQTLPPLPSESKGSEAVQDELGLGSPRVYNGPYLTKKPNVISGIVKAKDGNLLPGVVVIVKNDKNRPVRAMKTNSLGQFVTTTSLENGVYTIELSRKDYSFGRYEVKLTGELVPTFEFIAD